MTCLLAILTSTPVGDAFRDGLINGLSNAWPVILLFGALIGFALIMRTGVHMVERGRRSRQSRLRGLLLALSGMAGMAVAVVVFAGAFAYR